MSSINKRIRERETSAATVTLDVSEATVSGEKEALAVMATRPRWK